MVLVEMVVKVMVIMGCLVKIIKRRRQWYMWLLVATRMEKEKRRKWC